MVVATRALLLRIGIDRRQSDRRVRDAEQVVEQQVLRVSSSRAAAVVEDAKGKLKEAVGTAAGRDDLIQEGKAQQDKADAQRDVAKKEAQAEASRKAADAAERLQRAHQ